MLSFVFRISCICVLVATLPHQADAQVTSPASAAQAILSPESVVVFASREQGRAILTNRDDYVSRLGRFDRMLRLKSMQPVSEDMYLDFLVANVLEWTDADIARLRPLVQQLRTAAQHYRLPLPSTVLLIKTTGEEEVGQAHTRANAIVLPQWNLDEDDDTLLFLLGHELFHVMSRHDADFRERAYGLIGFRIGNEISLPASIKPLQITNPDAPRHDSYIDLTSNGQQITVVPILLSRSAVFDPQIGTELDDYWTLRLLLVTRTSPGDGYRVLERNGAAAMLKLNQIEGFVEQVGRNTRYVIHGEEILAENFALMITGSEVAEPDRLDDLRGLLVRPR